MKAQGLAETNQQSGKAPSKTGIIVPTDEDEEEHEGLDNGKIRLGEKLGLRQRLFDSETILLDQGLLLRFKIYSHL